MKKKLLRIFSYMILLGALFAALVMLNRAVTIDAADLTRGVIEEKGQIMLTGGSYAYTADNRQVYELDITWQGTGYLFFPRAETVLINDNAPESMKTYRGRLYRIEGTEGCEDFKITVYPSKSELSVPETYVYFGTYEKISGFDIIATACNYFLEGFCLAIVVISLILMLVKPSEKYLRWLALMAFFTGSYTRLKIILNLVGLSVLTDANMYQVINQLFIAFIQFKVMEEFMRVRFGRFHMLIPCLVFALPAILLFRNASLFPMLLIQFYAVLYIAYFVCFSGIADGINRTVLLVAWVITTAMRFLELFCDAGLLPGGPLTLQLRLRGLVSVVYIAALTILVCRRFANKFIEADQLNASLEKQVEEKSRENLKFVRSMLHNMKTPMFSLSGYSDIAYDAVADDPDRARLYITKLKDKAIYLSHLMDDISLVTRMNSGVVTINRQRLEIKHTVEQCVEAASAELGKKRISVSTDIEETYIDADTLYFPQAIQNVLDNAIIHTDAGGEIHIGAQKSPDGRELLLTIRDNGCGIASGDLDKIFDAYYSNRHGKTASTGLGLFITREILKLHGGSITVASEEGSGSAFTMTVPAASHQSSENI